MNLPLFLKRAAKIRTFSLPANFSALFFDFFSKNLQNTAKTCRPMSSTRKAQLTNRLTINHLPHPYPHYNPHNHCKTFNIKHLNPPTVKMTLLPRRQSQNSPKTWLTVFQKYEKLWFWPPSVTKTGKNLTDGSERLFQHLCNTHLCMWPSAMRLRQYKRI